jgi:aspartate racemase
MHIVYDEIVQKTGEQLISIPKSVAEEIARRGYKKVGLLGTIFTMEQDYMKKDLVKAGIEVCIPEKADRELVAKRIYEELEVGIVKESTLKEFTSIIEKMKKEQGIQALILGCTELPLLLNKDNCPVDCLDSVEIHLEKLIELAM